MADKVKPVHTLYCGFFERGVRYFFPEAKLSAAGGAVESVPSLTIASRVDGSLDLEWMGMRYHLEHCGQRPFTEDQIRLLGAIGGVLSARYRSLFFPASAASATHLFEGLAEDRYVSAFLDHFPYLDGTDLPTERDVLADAIEVLRESSLITYENRRISTGVILLSDQDGQPSRSPAHLPQDVLPYTKALVSIKSFHRLCDGLNTVFLVDRDGMLIDLVDVQQFSKHVEGAMLPAPSAARYRPHCLATLNTGHTCLVLTPNGEIKVFAGGVQVLHFLEGRWNLTDLTEKYHDFHMAVGNPRLAERLFTVALNLAENRRGGLFVLLQHPEAAGHLVAPADLLENSGPESSSKAKVHYLLRRKSALELDLSILQSIARVDGGIVTDREGRLLAFGAILRNTGRPVPVQDGSRTTAAVHASRFGLALKVSEDGQVAFYNEGAKVWEI